MKCDTLDDFVPSSRTQISDRLVGLSDQMLSNSDGFIHLK